MALRCELGQAHADAAWRLFLQLFLRAPSGAGSAA
ncbi:hypothetical protein SSAG_01215 [Streptomyces sp. Mg1]|nr:hypothetical protein SSAG_01215 [Streptomyces sp. Mg1]